LDWFQKQFTVAVLVLLAEKKQIALLNISWNSGGGPHFRCFQTYGVAVQVLEFLKETVDVYICVQQRRDK
jgi:hypothetical protein